MCSNSRTNALVASPVGHLTVLATIVRLLAFGAARQANRSIFHISTIPAELTPKWHQLPDYTISTIPKALIVFVGLD